MKSNKTEIRDLCLFLMNECKNKKKTLAILEDLLTPNEIISIAERLKIMKELTDGKTHRDIAKRLKISIGKVTRGSRILQYGKVHWGKLLKS